MQRNQKIAASVLAALFCFGIYFFFFRDTSSGTAPTAAQIQLEQKEKELKKAVKMASALEQELRDVKACFEGPSTFGAAAVQFQRLMGNAPAKRDCVQMAHLQRASVLYLKSGYPNAFGSLADMNTSKTSTLQMQINTNLLILAGFLGENTKDNDQP